MTEDNNKQPFWLIQIAAFALIILFISLGLWQIERGNFKRELKETADNISVTDALYLPINDPTKWRNKHIKFYGHYWPERQFLLDNQVRDQLPGYNVLTPFFVEKYKSWVLVDRGWIAQEDGRAQLPIVDVSNADRTITGQIYVPYQAAFTLGDIAEGEDSGWPRRIQFVDYIQLADRLGVELQAFTVRLDPRQPSGYRRDWLNVQLPAAKHYAYAFQWFALAVAVVMLWWVYVLRPILRRSEQ